MGAIGIGCVVLSLGERCVYESVCQPRREAVDKVLPNGWHGRLTHEERLRPCFEGVDAAQLRAEAPTVLDALVYPDPGFADVDVQPTPKAKRRRRLAATARAKKRGRRK